MEDDLQMSVESYKLQLIRERKKFKRQLEELESKHKRMMTQLQQKLEQTEYQNRMLRNKDQASGKEASAEQPSAAINISDRVKKIHAARQLLAATEREHQAVLKWCGKGGIYKHHGHVGMATSDPNEDIEVRLIWSRDGLGTISEPLHASELEDASAKEQNEAVRSWCRAGGIYKLDGRVGVALMNPDANAEIKLMWSGDGRGSHSTMLKAATLQLALVEDQKKAVKPWFNVGIVCKYNGKVGIVTSELDGDAQTILKWYNGHGTLSYPIKAAKLQLATSAEQHHAVLEWCHGGGVYKFRDRVGWASADPNFANEVKLIWSGDGLGRESEILNAAELEIATPLEQKLSVCAWCFKGGIYKSAGGVGVAVTGIDDNAEMQLEWSNDGHRKRSKLLLAAKLQLASSEDQQLAVKSWFHVGVVCELRGDVGIVTDELDKDAKTVLMWYNGQRTSSGPVQVVRLNLASLSNQFLAVSRWCHKGGIYQYHGRVGVATSNPSKNIELRLKWSNNSLGEVSEMLNAAELKVASEADQVAAVEQWYRPGDVYLLHGRVGEATTPLDSKAETILMWYDGKGTKSERKQIVRLQLASIAEQRQAICEWCRAGHVCKYVSGTTDDLQVGMVMMPPDEDVKVQLMWSSGGKGTESKLLDAAKLRIVSNDEQIAAVKDWCVRGAVYKSLREPNFPEGRIGVAVRHLNEHAEMKLCWLDTGTSRETALARAATLRFATAEEQMEAIKDWCCVHRVYACRNSGLIGVSISDPQIVKNTVQVRMFWVESIDGHTKSAGCTVRLRGLKDSINGLLATVVRHSDHVATICNLHEQPGLGSKSNVVAMLT